jgi:hypothetical protein
MSENNQKVSVQMPVCEHSTPAKTLSWLLRHFLYNVCEKNLQGDPRRKEAHTLAVAMIVSANDTLQITSQEAHDISVELKKIEEQIYPGCSLI